MKEIIEVSVKVRVRYEKKADRTDAFRQVRDTLAGMTGTGNGGSFDFETTSARIKRDEKGETTMAKKKVMKKKKVTKKK